MQFKSVTRGNQNSPEPETTLSLVRFPIFPNFETRSFLLSIHPAPEKRTYKEGKFGEAQLRGDQIYFKVDGILHSLPQLRHSWATIHISAHCVYPRWRPICFWIAGLDNWPMLFLRPVVSNYGKMRARRENWIRFVGRSMVSRGDWVSEEIECRVVY